MSSWDRPADHKGTHGVAGRDIRTGDQGVRLHDIDHTTFCSNVLDKRRPEAKRIYYAALCGFHSFVKFIIREYPQYASNVCGNYGSALHVASDAGRLQVVRLLLKHGVNVVVCGMWDQTPLQFASDAGRLDVVKCLLAHGADVNSEDESRWTPLFHAIYKGHFDVVRMLLDHMARANIHDTDGRTPLHMAFLRDNLKVTKSLVYYSSTARVQTRAIALSRPPYIS